MPTKNEFGYPETQWSNESLSDKGEQDAHCLQATDHPQEHAASFWLRAASLGKVESPSESEEPP